MEVGHSSWGLSLLCSPLRRTENKSCLSIFSKLCLYFSFGFSGQRRPRFGWQHWLMSASPITLSPWLFDSSSVAAIFSEGPNMMHSSSSFVPTPICASLDSPVFAVSDLSSIFLWALTNLPRPCHCPCTLTSGHFLSLSRSFFCHLPWHFGMSASPPVCDHFLQDSESQPSNVLVMCILGTCLDTEPICVSCMSWKGFPHQ